MFGKSIPILCYHNLDGSGDERGGLGHPTAYFEQHLDLIQELGFRTISAQHLLDICAGQQKHDGKYVVITFDDCHLSQWLYAAPLLAKRNMTAVFFAVTDFLWDGPPRTVATAPPLSDAADAFKLAVTQRDYTQFLNRAEMAALIQDYGMEVYAHSAGHQGCFKNLRQIGPFAANAHWTAWGIYPNRNPAYPVFEHASAYAYNGFWPQFADQASMSTFKLRSDNERYAFCRRDFRRSFEQIAPINRAARQLFCWPWGQFDKLALQALQAAGFAGAFTLERARTGRGTNPFRLNRILVGRTHTHRWLRARLAMYSSALGASVFCKYFRKKNEFQRVLYVTDSTKISGGGRQLSNNVAALAQCGVRPYLAAPAGSPLTTALSGADVTIIPWEHSKQVVRSALWLRRIVREQRIDVVHTFHSKPAKIAVLAKLLGGRFKLYLNRGVIYRPNPLIGLFAAIADGVICNSHKSANLLKAYLTPNQKLCVIYNSFTGPIAPQTPANRHLLRIIYVGNANPVKGHDLFLQTAQTYRQRYPASPVRFISYGVGPQADLTRFAAQATLDGMELYGDTPHDEVLQALAQADIFVLTSRLESMPNVVLEAFSAALPVVCTNVGGVGELVQDGVNGWLCASEDVVALAEKIQNLVAHPEIRLQMGAINHKIAAYLQNVRKGYLVLRVYSGERISETIPFAELAARAME